MILNVASDLQETVPEGYNVVSLHREPCSTPFMTTVLGFLTPPGPNEAKMVSQLC